MKTETRQQLEAGEAGEWLYVGSPRSGLRVLEPAETKTVAKLGDGKDRTPPKAVFATDSLDVAIFAAAVWTRDCLSGWHTYPGAQHEFFAVPSALKQALGRYGSLYLVERSRFKPYPEIPSEYVSYDDVPIQPGNEFTVNILDMYQRIQESSVFRRPDQPRPYFSEPAPPLSAERIGRLLASTLIHEDHPIVAIPQAERYDLLCSMQWTHEVGASSL